MLVLTRRPGDTILIHREDETIEVVLVSLKNGQARIGIQAPNNYRIARAELPPLGDNHDHTTRG